MIDAIRIQNLRSLKDTGFVKLKRLNILLGGNSSGKSTFLRSFPLFAQSVNKNLRGPISWFDDSMVDFGNYETAKSVNANADEKISFSYSLISPFTGYDYYGYQREHSWLFDKTILGLQQPINYAVSLSNDKNGTFVSEITIEVCQHNCSFFIEKRDDSVKVMLDGGLYPIPKCTWRHDTGNFILPRFENLKDGDSFLSIKEKLNDNLFSIILKYCRKNFTRKDKINSLVFSWSFDKSTFLESLKKKAFLKSFHKHAVSWTVEDEAFLEIYNNLLVSFFLSSIGLLDAEITSFYGNCGYIAPYRAEASRYYRSQGLQVDEIDPYGRNLQEFISSLSPSLRENYNSFLFSLLGVSVIVKPSAGHYSIMLIENGKTVNMTDVGFGYSQILPILTKLWFVHSKKRFFSFRYRHRFPHSYVTLIEQPELHLHPAMQAVVASAFVDFLNFKNNDVGGDDMLFVETHSQTIINRIGKLVRLGDIKPDEVNVLLFEKDKKTGDTKIRVSKFNEKGQLQNWPFGFFDPDSNIL